MVGHASVLKALHFDLINIRRDIEELNGLAYSYADKAEVNFDNLSTEDFLQRLAHACGYRWGLVIEMVIEALSACAKARKPAADVRDFEDAFKRIYGLTSGYTPFTAPDFLNAFDPENLLKLLNRDD